MTATYDVTLVALSLIVAVTGGYAAFDLLRRAGDGRRRMAWTVAAAAVLAAGLWTTHLTGLLALRLPTRVAFEPARAVLSVAVALLGCGVAIALASRPGRRRPWRVAAAGLGLGATILGVHFCAVFAMHMYPAPRFEPVTIGAATVPTLALCMLGLWMSLDLRDGNASMRRMAVRAGGAGILGLAFAGLHYAAMRATAFPAYSTSLAHGPWTLGRPELSLILMLLSLGILNVILIGSMFETRLNQHTRNLLASLQATNEQLKHEIRERKRAAQALRHSQQRYQSLFQHHPDAVYSLDLKGRYTAANPSAFRLTGYSPGDLGSLTFEKLVAPRDIDHARSLFHNAREGKPQHFEADCIRKDGSRFRANVTNVPIFVGKRVVGVFGIAKDVSRREQAESDLRLAANALENAREGIAVIDLEHRVVFVNQAFSRITGRRSRDVLGQPLAYPELKHQDTDTLKAIWSRVREHGHWEGEVWNRRQSGDVYPELLSISSVRDDDGRVSNYVLVFNDISTHKDYEARLAFMAHHDALTGLPNRPSFYEHGRSAIRRARRQGQVLAVLFFDLDRFKAINDSLGHSVGDEVLKLAAERVQGCMRETDVVARLGGDEFTALLENLTRPLDAERVAQALLRALGEPLEVDGQSLSLSASIGISCFPRDGDSIQILIKNADAAMYQAKQHGRDGYRFFAGRMMDRIPGRCC